MKHSNNKSTFVIKGVNLPEALYVALHTTGDVTKLEHRLLDYNTKKEYKSNGVEVYAIQPKDFNHLLNKKAVSDLDLDTDYAARLRWLKVYGKRIKWSEL